jgi:putative NADPH-quinone reductase
LHGGGSEAVESCFSVLAHGFGHGDSGAEWSPGGVGNDEVVRDGEWLFGARVTDSGGDPEVNLVSWVITAGVNSEHFRSNDSLGSIVSLSEPVVGGA